MKPLYYPLKKILFFLIVTLSYFTSNASIVGSHIGYRAIDSTKYEVILTYYRDCNGSPAPSTMQISVLGKSTGFFNVSLNRVSTKDITGIGANCPSQSRCSGSYPYGFEEHVYKGTVDISGGGCTYTFSFSRCCRSPSIVTGPANTNHYNEAVINKCYGINTSVQADITPDVLVATGQDYKGRIFRGDTADNDDSVVYRLVSALSSLGTPVSYSPSQFNAQRPVTFLGFPSTTLNLPAGFHFDGQTSELAFRPTKQNQHYLLCVEAREFRRVNGVMEIAATTRMEVSPIVVAMSNNRVPTVTGKSVVACAGEPITLTFSSGDINRNDSTTLTIDGEPNGAIKTYTRVGNHMEGKITWTPTNSDVRNTPYILTVTATDNACPLAGKATKAFSIIVRESPNVNDIKITSKAVKCSSAEVVLDIASNIIKPVISITDEDNISFSANDTARLFFKGSGWKKFTVKVSSDNYCDYLLTDSVLINPQYSLQLNTKNDSSVCPNSSVTFFSNPLNGNAPYDVYWFENSPQYRVSNISSFFKIINTSSTTKVVITDSNYCIGLDSTLIDVYVAPVIKADREEVEVCPNTPFQLSASYVTGASPIKYEWLGIDTLQTVSTQSNIPRTYIVEATSKDGCKATASTQLKLFAVGVDAGSYTTVCRNTSVQLNANVIVGNFPRTLTWLHNNTQAATTSVNVAADSSFVIRLEDGRGCFAYDTAYITTFAPTQYQLPANPTTCAGVPINLQLSNIVGNGPLSFIWDGQTSTDSSTTVTLQQGKNIPFDIIDKNNCKVSDNINVTVNQNPDSRLGTDKTVCQGATEKLNAFVIGGKRPLSYLWSTGSQDDSTTVLVNTPQEIILLVTDDNGCIDRDTINFDTLPSQKPILTPLNNPFCDNAPPVSLQSTPNTGIWTGAGVNGKIFNPNTAGAGVHPLTFSFTSIYNCPEKGEIVAIVKQTPQPDFTVDKPKGRPNTVFSFTNLTTADTTFTSEWNMGDGSPLISTPNVNHTYTNVGTYTVTLKVDNGVCAAQTEQKLAYVEVDSMFTSVTQLEKEGIKVYPNPVNETLFLSSEINIERVVLFDVLGKKIIEQKTNAPNTEINVSELNKGVYTLSILLENGTAKTTKLIVN